MYKCREIKDEMQEGMSIISTTLESIEPGEGAGGIVGGFHRYRIDRIAITFL